MDNNNRAFKLLNLLYNQQGEYIKSKDILKELNCTTRNIPNMIAKLTALGYVVKSKGGYHGGYRIIDNDLLSENEINHIKSLLEKEDQTKTYPDKRNMIILNKILKLNKKVKIK